MADAVGFIDRLSPYLFWDVQRDAINAESNASFLICRIMERGTRSDVRAAWSFYGPDRIRETLIQAPSLTAKTISFFANQFALPKHAFRAYQRSSNWHQ